jgi:hypothetical protein
VVLFPVIPLPRDDFHKARNTQQAQFLDEAEDAISQSDWAVVRDRIEMEFRGLGLVDVMSGLAG